jgi:hypothetical protein
MVRGQDILRAEKSEVDWGKWQTGGMTTAAFPLSKRRGRAYKLGSMYRWRVVSFQALGLSFRLLIAFNLAKEQFRATLALEQDRDMSVIASYEFHGTHPGWHVHGACGDVNLIPSGCMRTEGQKRLPAPRATHRRVDFNVTDDDTALEMAAKFFGLHKKEGALL